MWALIEFIVLAAIVLIAVTEFFYPLIARKPLFGSFRSKSVVQPKAEDTSLEQKLSTAKEKIKEVKDIQNEVDKNFKSAEQLKEEADNLFNK